MIFSIFAIFLLGENILSFFHSKSAISFAKIHFSIYLKSRSHKFVIPNLFRNLSCLCNVYIIKKYEDIPKNNPLGLKRVQYDMKEYFRTYIFRHNGKKCVAVLTTSPRFQRADKGVN